jgi:hypothetical protein
VRYTHTVRSIMPMRLKPLSPAESIATGLAVGIVGQFFDTAFSRYGFVALGALLVGLGIYGHMQSQRRG